MMLSGLLSFSLLTSGQCVVAVPSLSSLNPSFDLSLCRAKLENDGFQVSAHRHGYTYLKELLWHCKILHLNLCWNQVADLFYPVRYQSATWRLHWRQLWTFPQSRDTWFSTRLSSISYWHRYDLLITTYNEHISLNFSAALTLFCGFFHFSVSFKWTQRLSKLKQRRLETSSLLLLSLSQSANMLQFPQQRPNRAFDLIKHPCLSNSTSYI